MYFKKKWCRTAGKDPLFGPVDSFQIDPNKIKILTNVTIKCGFFPFKNILYSNRTKKGAMNYV